MAEIDLMSWTDANGRRRPTPQGKKLRFPTCASHAALRAFVFVRDKFTCRDCGTKPLLVPFNYDGRSGVTVPRQSEAGFDSYLVVDHVTSRRYGGSNHPSNLQTLCDPCNAAKGNMVDRQKGDRNA